MMKSLATFALRGPSKAIMAVAGLAVASLLFFPLSWPLSYASAGIVALVALTQSSRDSLLIVFGATGVLAVLGILVGGILFGIGYALTVWLPAWLVALWLRQRQSLSQALLLAGLVGLIGISILFVIQGDPTQWWVNYFDQNVIQALHNAEVKLPDEAAFRDMLHESAPLMNGAMLTLLVMSAIIGLLLGRYWQAQLFEAVSALEFRQLRFGTLAASTALLIMALSQFVGGLAGQWLANAALVVATVFLFQGLAVAHTLVGRARNPLAWLVALYIVVFFTLPYGVVVIAMLGMLDNWIELRRRFPGAAG